MPTGRATLQSIAVWAMLAACCTPRPVGPITTVEELSRGLVHDWLNQRFDRDSWAVFSAATAAWRLASSVDELAAWFPAALDPDAQWDFGDNVVAAIRTSDVFARDPRTDSELLLLLHGELAAHRWTEGRDAALTDAVATQVRAWLDPLLADDPDDRLWQEFRRPEAGWRDEAATPDVPALVRWFRERLGARWDLQALVDRIASSPAARAHGLETPELVRRLRQALADYQRP